MINFKVGDYITVTDCYRNLTVEASVSKVEKRRTRHYLLTWIFYDTYVDGKLIRTDQWTPTTDDEDNI
jgi:hypothetical protein